VAERRSQHPGIHAARQGGHGLRLPSAPFVRPLPPPANDNKPPLLVQLRRLVLPLLIFFVLAWMAWHLMPR
jgi:hypothetical protein